MSTNNFYEQLIENDLNPYILFDNNGKLKDFNKEAEFLFNYVKPKELYELAISNASASFGFNPKFILLKYGKFSFYAILVGYINDDEIALRLYKEVTAINEITTINSNLELVNIYSLIEISVNTILLQENIQIEEIYDVSIPEMKVNINNFLLTLNDCFGLCRNSKTLKLKVSIKMGEYEVIEKKKYQIICIEFIANNIANITKDMDIKANKSHTQLCIDNGILKLEFPMVL